MANSGGAGLVAAPDLQTLIRTAQLAATARQQELTLYNQARAAGNLAGLTAHFQGYQAALQVEQKANAVLNQALVDTPTLQTDMVMLAEANQGLAAATQALAADTNALNLFTSAANAALTVLGAIALL